MSGRVVWGRLDEGVAPAEGERTIPVATGRGFSIEQILSGRLPEPADYDQDHDEWAVVLEGGAVLDVDGTEQRLGAGDWVLLPAHVPHRLVRTEPGTRWLVVRGPATA